MGSGEWGWTSALFRAGQARWAHGASGRAAGSEKCGAGCKEQGARSRMGKGGHRPGRRMCVRGVVSGTARGGGEDLPQEAATCQEGSVSDSIMGISSLRLTIISSSGIGLDLARAQ